MSDRSTLAFRPLRGTLRSLSFFGFLVVVFSTLSPHFASFSNMQNVIVASAVISILALAQTFVIASGGLDLSIASVMAFCGTVAAIALHLEEVSPVIAIALCFSMGGALGGVTGFLVNLTRAPSFIVTLGMLSVVRASAYIVSGGIPIYGLREDVSRLGQGEILGVAGPVWFVVAAAIVSHILLHHTTFGLHLLFLGDRKSAALSAGIDLNWLRLRIHMLCGALSGLAGFVFMARTNAGDPSAGQNYELMAVTAVILGGAKLYGGSASIVGTLLGAASLGVLQNGLNLLAIGTYYQVLFIGLVLVVSAFLDRLGAHDE